MTWFSCRVVFTWDVPKSSVFQFFVSMTDLLFLKCHRTNRTVSYASCSFVAHFSFFGQFQYVCVIEKLILDRGSKDYCRKSLGACWNGTNYPSAGAEEAGKSFSWLLNGFLCRYFFFFPAGWQQIGLCFVMTAIQEFGYLARKFYKVSVTFRRILTTYCQVKNTISFWSCFVRKSV